MSNFLSLKNLLNCKFCSNVLQEPVILPCGQTLCKIHSEEISKKECFVCSEINTIPDYNGFPNNDLVQAQLEMKLNLLNIDLFHFNNCQEMFQDLNKRVKETESVRNDSDNYVYEYFAELRRQVDLRRDTIINSVQEYSNKMIEQIDHLEQECFIMLRRI